MRCKVVCVPFFLLCLLISTLALAFDEPQDFRGLKFGQDLTQQLPKCQDTETAYDIRRCWEPQKSLKELGVIETDDDTPRYLIRNEPPIGRFNISEVIANQIDGKMESMSIVFRGWFAGNHSDTQEMIDILQARYLNPSSDKEEKDEFAGRMVCWRGASIGVDFIQIVYKPFQSWTITFHTIRHDVYHAAKKKAKAQKSASGF